MFPQQNDLNTELFTLLSASSKNMLLWQPAKRAWQTWCDARAESNFQQRILRRQVSGKQDFTAGKFLGIFNNNIQKMVKVYFGEGTVLNTAAGVLWRSFNSHPYLLLWKCSIKLCKNDCRNKHFESREMFVSSFEKNRLATITRMDVQFNKGPS